MKNKTKAKIFTGIMAVSILVTLPLILMGCDDGTTQEDLEKYQDMGIDGLFDNNSKARVEGTFTKAELNVVSGKIKAVINKKFGEISDGAKNNYKNAFASGNVIIIVERTDEYVRWKTIGDSKTIYLNYNSLDETDLHEMVGGGIASMGQGKTGMAKVIVSVPKFTG